MKLGEENNQAVQNRKILIHLRRLETKLDRLSQKVDQMGAGRLPEVRKVKQTSLELKERAEERREPK